MELLDLPQLAERAGLPLSLARYYRDRFILFVPSVRIGRTVMHPYEAVEVLQVIADAAKTGASASAIESALEQAYPVTVITSQEVARDGRILGAGSVVNELASVLDDRGARLETEIASIREHLAELTSAAQLLSSASIVPQQTVPDVIPNETATELVHLKHMVEEMQQHQASLASHEQLEWIGDVVAAAVLRPAESGSKDSIERRLADIQDELRRPRPNAEAAELLIAVERLTERVQSRDEEYQRILHSLVGAMRSEVGSLKAGIGELRQSINAGPSSLPMLLTSHRTESNGLDLSPTSQPVTEVTGDYQKSRSPRRLGQPTRPPEMIVPDHEPSHEME